MKNAKWILVSVALVAVLALSAACDSGAEPTTAEGSTNDAPGITGESFNLTNFTSADLTGLAKSLA